MRQLVFLLAIIISIAGCKKEIVCFPLPPTSSTEATAVLDTATNIFSITHTFHDYRSGEVTRLVFPKVNNATGKSEIKHNENHSFKYDTLLYPYLQTIKGNEVIARNYLCQCDSSWMDIQKIDLAGRKMEGVFYVSMIKDSLFFLNDSIAWHSRRMHAVLKADIVLR